MGDNFLEDQTEKCQKRRDLAALEVSYPTLFERPEVFRRVYDVKPFERESFSVDETLLAQFAVGQSTVAVMRGCQTIGLVVGEGADILWEGLKKTCGTARVRVVDVLPLSGVGKIELINGDSKSRLRSPNCERNIARTARSRPHAQPVRFSVPAED